MDVIQFKDIKTVPDIVHPYTNNLKFNALPIVIDNGSYTCHAGWSSHNLPLLTFKNLIAKPRKERSKKDSVEVIQTPQLQVGNDIINIETVRFQLKTQFDRNVVTHFEAQEHLFDYTFSHLGIDTEKQVNHPVVITEAFLNPNSSRQLMSELLFECYEVPGVVYGIDSLYAHHFSSGSPAKDALIISLGYHTMHIIPVLNHKAIFENTRRINTGGYHVVSFLHRMLQLKYPGHAASITLSRAEELVHGICLIAKDYREELKKWNDVDYYESNIRKIQLPFTISVAASTLTVEQQKERKKELARRLTEINARRRGERLAEDEDKLQKLLHIQDLYEMDATDEIDFSTIENMKIDTVEDLERNIAVVKARIEKTKQKIFQSNNIDEISDEPPNKNPKLNKMVFENENAMVLYVQNAKRMKQEIITKKVVRKQRKQDMAKRRTAAGQERMRLISQLARKEKGNDDFGMRDEDWDIYKTISKDGGDSDSDAENEKLIELDEIIKTYEPAEDSDNLAPAEAHQLHIGIERYRAPELLFKPYMVGSGEAGLSEVIGYVLKLFSPEDQLRLAGNVVLMGGMARMAGLKERLQTDLTCMRPFQSYSHVSVFGESSLTSWHGARNLANGPEFGNCLITRAEYEEFGGEYFKMHAASNMYVPSPKEQIVEVDT